MLFLDLNLPPRRGHALFGIKYFYIFLHYFYSCDFNVSMCFNILYVNLCQFMYVIFLGVSCALLQRLQGTIPAGATAGVLQVLFRNLRPRRSSTESWCTSLIWPDRCYCFSGTVALSPKVRNSANFAVSNTQCCSCYVFTGSSSSKRKPTLIGLVIPRSSQSGPDEINVATPFAQLPQPLQPQLGKFTCSLWIWFFYISSLIIQYYILNTDTFASIT